MLSNRLFSKMLQVSACPRFAGFTGPIKLLALVAFVGLSAFVAPALIAPAWAQNQSSPSPSVETKADTPASNDKASPDADEAKLEDKSQDKTTDKTQDKPTDKPQDKTTDKQADSESKSESEAGEAAPQDGESKAGEATPKDGEAVPQDDMMPSNGELIYEGDDLNVELEHDVDVVPDDHKGINFDDRKGEERDQASIFADDLGYAFVRLSIPQGIGAEVGFHVFDFMSVSLAGSYLPIAFQMNGGQTDAVIRLLMARFGLDFHVTEKLTITAGAAYNGNQVLFGQGITPFSGRDEAFASIWYPNYVGPFVSFRQHYRGRDDSFYLDFDWALFWFGKPVIERNPANSYYQGEKIYNAINKVIDPVGDILQFWTVFSVDIGLRF